MTYASLIIKVITAHNKFSIASNHAKRHYEP